MERTETRAEIRCIHCNRLLGKVPEGTQAEIEMKCPRCRIEHTYILGGDRT